MKEEIKDKLNDLHKTLAIILGIVGFISMAFIPNSILTIIFFLIVAGLHLWVISKIIVRYKNMTCTQRQGVLIYFLFIALSVILMIMAYKGMFNRWVKNEDLNEMLNSLGDFGIGYVWVIGLSACKKEEE